MLGPGDTPALFRSRNDAEAAARYGLRDTATVYAIAVIALALAAALATGRTLHASRRAVDITTDETTKSEI